jgi:hypothetical protein
MNILLNLFFLLFFSCSNSYNSEIWLNELDSNKSGYNEDLINREDGFHSINGFKVQDSSFGIIMVHGYYPKSWNSKGYEWVEPLKILSKNKVSMWLYKYNWNGCSNDIADSLKKHSINLIEKNNHLDSLWFLGHSFGGLISTIFSEKWKKDFPISVHSIAAPLKDINRSDDLCDTLERDEYTIAQNVKYSQWKTIQSADGAFKHLNYDPQMIKIKNGKIISLPGDWKEKRLGHNRSILFVSEHITN